MELKQAIYDASVRAFNSQGSPMKVLKSSTKESAARVGVSTAKKFFEDLAKNSGLSFTFQASALLSAKADASVAQVSSALKKLGWSETSNGSFVRADGSWPLTVKKQSITDQVWVQLTGSDTSDELNPESSLVALAKKIMPSGFQSFRDSVMWSKKGGHAGAVMIDRAVEKAEKLGFYEAKLLQHSSPDGSMIVNQEILVKDDIGLFTNRSYGVTASQNYFSLSLRPIDPREYRKASRENSAPLPTTAYDYYKLVSEPFAITCPTGRLRLAKGDVYGVRPSTSGKQIRLIRPGAPGKVYSLDFPAGQRLADMSRPYRGKVVHASAEE